MLLVRVLLNESGSLLIVPSSMLHIIHMYYVIHTPGSRGAHKAIADPSDRVHAVVRVQEVQVRVTQGVDGFGRDARHQVAGGWVGGGW